MSNKPSTKQKAAERTARAQQLMKEQRARERRRNAMFLGVGGVVVALLVGAFVVFGLMREDVRASSAGQSEFGVTLGEADAPRQLVIYEDFLCPACQNFEAQTSTQLDELAADGEVFIDYRPFNLLGEYSERATNAFGVVREVSGPEVAKAFKDRLYANQPSEGGDLPDDDWLIEQAVAAGADEDAVRAGIEAGTDFSERATAEAQAAGVRGTPTVILDGEVFNGGPADLLSELR